jgi:2-polyprenyl-3-methyl-5-hydroxy-6-metoxy-1,4-benzoquinol methylase
VGTRGPKIAEHSAKDARYAIEQPPTGERRVMLERVPSGASVLDVGCWSGSVGSFLIEHRNATVDGVEPDARMASLARRHYRDVFVGPLEDFLGQNQRRYDRVLFLDVLEHLPEPAEPLRRAKELLHPGGRALVSIPNVAHWSLRKELLLGRWRYEATGLLDRTHLRFFTLESAAELLTDAGWEITWASVSLGEAPVITLPRKWLASLKRWPSLFAVQGLFEIEPA